jgi:putative membrane protein
MDHIHHEGASLSADALLALPFAVALVVYLSATALQFRRANRWPWYRTLLWVIGVVAAASAFVGPVATGAHSSFAGHMTAHALVGMVAPLCVVLAAPVTLALRSINVVPARRLSRLLNSSPARWLTHPAVAAVINVGSLWVLYRSPLYGAAQHSTLLHTVVMAHFLVAGVLFTASIIPVDPAPHRTSYPVRMGVLVIALAAHGILAKTLYANPPTGVSAADAEAGSVLMYYSGDIVDIVIITILCARWYAHTGRMIARATPPVRPTSTA